MSPVRIRLPTLAEAVLNAAARPWHGLLNIDKPAGMTSRDVVNRVGRLLKKTKIGHAGTLDPLATGVLVVCIGSATRLVDRVQEHLKGYRVHLKLGVRSDTDDITGRLSPGGDCSHITAADISSLLEDFRGDISQVPPDYSAVHVDGRRAYDLARTQQEFELTARHVRVESISLTSFAGETAELEIVCGSGTYIRSIIRDLGERLGCGAVMTDLRRTFIGPFRDMDALPLDELSMETLATRLQPLRSVLSGDVTYSATAADCAALLQGRPVRVETMLCAESARVAVLDPTQELFAFAAWDPVKNSLQPQAVFVR